MKDLLTEVREAVRDVSDPSKQCVESAPVAKWRDSKVDQNKRDLGMTKLFSLYPPPPDMETSLAAYVEETSDIPWLFVSHAIRRLIDRPVYDRGALMPRKWLPTISELRYEAARVIREAKLRSEGRDPREYSLHGEFQLNPDRWIDKAPEVLVIVRQQQLRLAAPELDRKQLASGER
jgi:hypothetical protein